LFPIKKASIVFRESTITTAFDGMYVPDSFSIPDSLREVELKSERFPGLAAVGGGLEIRPEAFRFLRSSRGA
jgi:hypothetical protein